MRAYEIIKETLNNKGDSNNDGVFDDERLIPRQRWTVSTDQFSYDTYRTVLQFGARDDFNDQVHRSHRGRYIFYSKQEYDEFCKFLNSENIPFESIGDQTEEGEEEDMVNSVSPVPSPTFRDIF